MFKTKAPPELRGRISCDVLKREDFLNEVFDDGVENGADALAVDVRRQDVLPESPEVMKLVQNLTDALLGLGRKQLTSGQLAKAWWLKCKIKTISNICSEQQLCLNRYPAKKMLGCGCQKFFPAFTKHSSAASCGQSSLI